MTVALIVALVLIVVLSYFVANLSHEVRQTRAHLTELRNGIDKANEREFTMRKERDEAKDYIKTTNKEIVEAIAKARQDREKIQDLLTRMKDYMQNEQS